MASFKISDEEIKDIIRVADEKEKEYLCSMTPISSLIFLFLVVLGLSYGFKTLSIFKIIFILLIIYLPLKGMLFLANLITQK